MSPIETNMISDLVDQDVQSGRMEAGMATAARDLMRQPVPDSAEAFDIDIVATLRKYLDDGTNAANGILSAKHERWRAYIKLADGSNPDDDPTDPLVAEYGVYFPILARAKDVLKANLLIELINDPSEMDFFNVKFLVEGLLQYGDAATALMRDKFRTMRPEDADEFYGLVDQFLEDYLIFGNLFGLCSHDSVIESDGTVVTEGPVVEKLDPMNVRPWRLDVDNIAQTEVSIYAPLNDDELDVQGYPEQLVQEIRKTVTKTAISKRDRRTSETSTEQSNPDEIAGWIAEDYERWICYGRFPIHQLQKLLNRQDEDYQAFRLEAVQALAALYGFDPTKAFQSNGQLARYWEFHWIGKHLVRCRPYPLALPRGRGPVVHVSMLKRNGYLLGYGLYDRGQWDERLYNFFQRALIRLTAFQIRPPMWYDSTAIDPEFLQEHQGAWELEWDMKVPVVMGTGNLSKPLEVIDLNSRSIPLMIQAAGIRDASLRELTGVHTGLEGKDESPTATQASNNLQQSRMLVVWIVRRLARSLLRDLVLRCYVIEKQAMEVGQLVQNISMSQAGSALQTLEVWPQHLVDEELIDVRVSGGTGLGSRMEQIAAVERFNDRWIPSGLLDLPRAAKLEGMIKGIPGLEQMLTATDPQQMMSWIQFSMMLFGPEGIRYLPQSVQQLMMGAPMMGGGGGMMQPMMGGGQRNPNGTGGKDNRGNMQQPGASARTGMTAAGAPIMNGGGGGM